MSQRSEGKPKPAKHRDLLGRPVGSPTSAAPRPLAETLPTALASANPWAIASVVVQSPSQDAGLEQVADALLNWSCSRGGDGALIASRILADGLRNAAGIDGSRRLVPMTQVAVLSAELQAGASPGQTDDGHGLDLPASATAGSAAMERALIGHLYDNAARAGHLAPFVAAACELRDACGDRAVATLHGALARRLADAISVPLDVPLVGHLSRVEALTTQLDVVHAAEQPERAVAFNEPRFRRHLLDGRPEAAQKAMYKALAYGIPRELVARSLTLAAADRVLRFDPNIASRSDRREGWADVGWLLSHTSAIRQLRHRLDAPGWLSLLAHGVFLVHAAAGLDAPKRALFVLPEPEALNKTWDHGPEIARITGRIQTGDGEGAMSALRGYLLLALPEQPLCAQLGELLFDDLAGRPNEQANLIATGCAAIEEFNALADHPHRELLLCAAIRRLTAPRQCGVAASAAVHLLSGRPATATTPLPWVDR